MNILGKREPRRRTTDRLLLMAVFWYEMLVLCVCSFVLSMCLHACRCRWGRFFAAGELMKRVTPAMRCLFQFELIRFHGAMTAVLFVGRF